MKVEKGDGATVWRDVLVVTRSSLTGGSPDGSWAVEVASSSVICRVSDYN